MFSRACSSSEAESNLVKMSPLKDKKDGYLWYTRDFLKI